MIYIVTLSGDPGKVPEREIQNGTAFLRVLSGKYNVFDFLAAVKQCLEKLGIKEGTFSSDKEFSGGFMHILSTKMCGVSKTFFEKHFPYIPGGGMISEQLFDDATCKQISICLCFLGVRFERTPEYVYEPHQHLYHLIPISVEERTVPNAAMLERWNRVFTDVNVPDGWLEYLQRLIRENQFGKSIEQRGFVWHSLSPEQHLVIIACLVQCGYYIKQHYINEEGLNGFMTFTLEMLPLEK